MLCGCHATLVAVVLAGDCVRVWLLTHTLALAVVVVVAVASGVGAWQPRCWCHVLPVDPHYGFPVHPRPAVVAA